MGIIALPAYKKYWSIDIPYKNEHFPFGQDFNDENNFGQTAATVLKLMTPFLNKGYNVFTDNYYNSVSLTKYLSNHGEKFKNDKRMI